MSFSTVYSINYCEELMAINFGTLQLDFQGVIEGGLDKVIIFGHQMKCSALCSEYSNLMVNHILNGHKLGTFFEVFHSFQWVMPLK